MLILVLFCLILKPNINLTIVDIFGNAKWHMVSTMYPLCMYDSVCVCVCVRARVRARVCVILYI